MVEGQGGLNIKDYPFAFSVAALLFPQILSDNTNTVPIILGITLIGGMLGSLLTIINPVGLLIREIYWRRSFLKVYPKLNSQNTLVKQILKKNFRAALSSPSISYESNKIVGMLYFLVILSLAIIRTLTGLSVNDTLLWGIRIGAIIGFGGVMLVLLHDVYGFTLKKSIRFISKKAISHLDRIRSVTISNLAVDFANLSNEGANRWLNRYVPNNQDIIRTVCNELSKMENLPISTFDDFGKAFPIQTLANEYAKFNMSWNQGYTLQMCFNAYRSAREVSLRYEVKLSQALTWFANPQFLNQTEFDDPISQLQTSIESRDWYNSTLKTYRITDRLEDFLENKRMLEKLP